MFKKLIKEHIDKLTTDDIARFAKENNIILNEDELNNLLIIVKNDWEELIYGDYKQVFSNNRSKVTNDNYNKIEELFYFFKKKYQRFL